MYGYGGRQDSGYQQQHHYHSSTQEYKQPKTWYGEQDAACHHFRERIGHQQQQQTGYNTGRMRQVQQDYQEHQQPNRDPNYQPHKRVRQNEQPLHVPQQEAEQQQQKQMRQWRQHRQEAAAVEQLPQGQPQRQHLQHPQRASLGNAAAPSFLDRLHDEIVLFTQQVVPNTEQQQEREMVLQRFNDAAQLALPEYARRMTVLLFGSGAAGLALHSSDLDVAITCEFRPTLAAQWPTAAKVAQQGHAMRAARPGLQLGHVTISQMHVMASVDAYHGNVLAMAACHLCLNLR
jgi:hypothetical protein